MWVTIATDKMYFFMIVQVLLCDIQNKVSDFTDIKVKGAVIVSILAVIYCRR